MGEPEGGAQVDLPFQVLRGVSSEIISSTSIAFFLFPLVLRNET
jgi:hypothetical protein